MTPRSIAKTEMTPAASHVSLSVRSDKFNNDNTCEVFGRHNGEIVEENLFYDQVGFLRQIGVL
jgi:hypothetical protein